jgi:hypothetical protein
MPSPSEQIESMTRTVAPDAGTQPAGTVAPPTQPPDAGKAAPVAPQPGQVAEPTPTDAPKTKDAVVPPDADNAEPPPKLTAKALKDAMTLKEVVDAESPEYLKRQNAASRKEADRLLAENKSFHAMLEQQGLKLVKDHEGAPQLVKAGKDGKPVDLGLKTVDEATRAQFQAALGDGEDNPANAEKAWSVAMAAAQKALATPQATAEKVLEPLSPERIDAAYSHVADKLGTLFPTVKDPETRTAILDSIQEASPAIRAAFIQDPAQLIGLYAAQAECVAAKLRRDYDARQAEQLKKKEAAARAAAGTLPSTHDVTVTDAVRKNSASMLDGIIAAAGRR